MADSALKVWRDRDGMLLRLREGDPTIPAGRVDRNHAVVLADRAAAGKL